MLDVAGAYAREDSSGLRFGEGMPVGTVYAPVARVRGCRQFRLSQLLLRPTHQSVSECRDDPRDHNAGSGDKRLPFCCHSQARIAQKYPDNDSLLVANYLILNNSVAEPVGGATPHNIPVVAGMPW